MRSSIVSVPNSIGIEEGRQGTNDSACALCVFRRLVLLEFVSAIAALHHGLLAFVHVLIRIALTDDALTLCAQVVHHENECV